MPPQTFYVVEAVEHSGCGHLDLSARQPTDNGVSGKVKFTYVTSCEWRGEHWPPRPGDAFTVGRDVAVRYLPYRKPEPAPASEPGDFATELRAFSAPPAVEVHVYGDGALIKVVSPAADGS